MKAMEPGKKKEGGEQSGKIIKDPEITANAHYMVNKGNRESLYSAKDAVAPLPTGIYDKENLTDPDYGKLIKWTPRAKLTTEKEMAYSDQVKKMSGIKHDGKKSLVLHNDCAEFARLLRANINDEIGKGGEDPEDQDIGAQKSHHYDKKGLGMFGQKDMACNFHSVTIVAKDIDWVTLEAHAGLKDLKAPMFHIRKGEKGFADDNDTVLDYVTREKTDKKRGLGENVQTADRNDLGGMSSFVLEQGNVEGKPADVKTDKEMLVDIEALTVLARSESDENLVKYIHYISGNKDYWKKKGWGKIRRPKGVKEINNKNNFNDIVKVAKERRGKDDEDRADVTRRLYEVLNDVAELKKVMALLKEEGLDLDPELLISEDGLTKIDRLFEKESGEFDKAEVVESKLLEKLIAEVTESEQKKMTNDVNYTLKGKVEEVLKEELENGKIVEEEKEERKKELIKELEVSLLPDIKEDKKHEMSERLDEELGVDRKKILKKVKKTSGLGNNCLIYAILDGLEIDNGEEVAPDIRDQLVRKSLATETSFLVNDQKVLREIFLYLKVHGYYAGEVTIHFIKYENGQILDDDKTWNRYGKKLYILNASNVHFSLMA